MNCGIYKIVNKTNGKFYIGSSNDFKTRFRGHRNKLNSNTHHCIHLQRAWNLYGEKSFEFIKIKELPNVKEQLHAEEQILLDEHYGKQYCYNSHKIARGGAQYGEKNPMFGKTHSDEVKKLLSEINSGSKNYWYDKPEHMEKMRSKITVRMHGKTHSEETKKRMSETRKGRKHKPETKEKIKKAHLGKINLGREKQKKPITVNGVYFDSFAAAGAAEGVPGNTIKYRVNSKNFPNYQYWQEGVETIETASLDERE